MKLSKRVLGGEMSVNPLDDTGTRPVYYIFVENARTVFGDIVTYIQQTEYNSHFITVVMDESC